ncbi:MAG: hypothetical protein ABJE00_06935, partial [Erythrobacter sp.]
MNGTKVDLNEAEGFYKAIRTSSNSPKKLKSLVNLWAALREMVEQEIPIRGVPDVGRYIQNNHGGSPALSTITNDTSGLNKLVHLVIKACDEVGHHRKTESRKRRTTQDIAQETLKKELRSEKSRACLEMIFRENNHLKKENAILRGAFANLTQKDLPSELNKASNPTGKLTSGNFEANHTNFASIALEDIQKLIDILNSEFDILLVNLRRRPSDLRLDPMVSPTLCPTLSTALKSKFCLLPMVN